MSRDDWMRKLTSRKFWAAIAGFVTGLVVYLKAPTTDPGAITALIMSLGTLIAYIVGEGLADAAGARSDTYLMTEEMDLDPEVTHPPEDADIIIK